MSRSSRVDVRISPRMQRMLDTLSPDNRSAAIRAYAFIGMAVTGTNISSFKGEISALAQEVEPGPTQDALIALMWTGSLVGSVSGQCRDTDEPLSGQLTDNRRGFVGQCGGSLADSEEPLEDDEDGFTS